MGDPYVSAERSPRAKVTRHASAEQLWQADCKEELLALLDLQLAESYDLSSYDVDGNTPLHLAVHSALGNMVGGSVIVETEVRMSTLSELASRLDFLLSRLPSSDIEAPLHLHNKDGYTPLHIAVANGSALVCKVLFKAGARINAYTLRSAWRMCPNGRTCGNWVKRDKTGKVEPRQATDQTALHLALQASTAGWAAADSWRRNNDDVDVDVALVRLLLENGADVNALDFRLRSPLHIAVTRGLYEVVELLASFGCEMAVEAVHLATLRKDVRLVKLLVQHGAPIDACGMLHGHAAGWTPLCLASRAGATAVAKVLISARANVHATSANGKTALEIAIVNRNRDDCKAVLELLQVSMVASVLELAFRRQ